MDVRQRSYRKGLREARWLALHKYGMGFKSADTIAQKLGIPKDLMIGAQA